MTDVPVEPEPTRTRILPPDEPGTRRHAEGADVRGAAVLTWGLAVLVILLVQMALLIVLVVQGA